MGRLSVEIKARCADLGRIRRILRSRGADFRGTDHQVDTYFTTPSGRLKLREGNIENALIHYKRADQKNSKRCDAVLMECADTPMMKKILTAACGVWVIVNKRREIYFLENVKIHLDRVKGLGTFVEIEAQDRAGKLGVAKVRAQCEFYKKLFGIRPEDLLADSYSDQLLDR
jgi:predicted adenylyl cyclase CyaB